MGQITEAFCLQMLRHAERKEHAPLTIWEEEQLARAWLRRDELERERAMLREALDAAFFALGRAGGNSLGSQYRMEWEKAREALEATKSDR